MQPQQLPENDTEIPTVDMPEIPEINRTEIGENTIHPTQTNPVAVRDNAQQEKSRVATE